MLGTVRQDMYLNLRSWKQFFKTLLYNRDQAGPHFFFILPSIKHSFSCTGKRSSYLLCRETFSRNIVWQRQSTRNIFAIFSPGIAVEYLQGKKKQLFIGIRATWAFNLCQDWRSVKPPHLQMFGNANTQHSGTVQTIIPDPLTVTHTNTQ